MEFRVLGPLQAWCGEVCVDLGDLQQRYVLAGLLMYANTPISVERLAEIVWPDVSGRKPHLVSGYISRLNRAFRQAGAGGALIGKTQTGYVLRVEPEQVDYLTFASLREHARAALEQDDRATAIASLREAIVRYRGELLADLEISRIGRRKRETLSDAYLDALGDLAELELGAGNHRWVRDHLQPIVRDHPTRQRLAAMLMRAFLGDGEPERAVTVYHVTREALGAKRGMQTSRQLKELLWRAEYGEAKASLPPKPTAFTGRSKEFESIRTAAWRAARDQGAAGVAWISGMPGVGKTALAVHAAHLLAKEFPGGQLYVDLHGFTPNVARVEPSAALDQLLQILGVPAGTVPSTFERRRALYNTWLEGTRTLVVLDNAESERHVEALLPTSPGCLAIVTSRHVGELAANTRVHLEPLPRAEAVRLFSGLVGTRRIQDQWLLVEDIVGQCGRLPLQIRVAAKQLLRHPKWPLDHLAALLREHSPWRADADADPTDETGAAACAVSYLQLGDEQRRLFRLFARSPCAELDAYGAAGLAGVTLPRARALLEALHRVSLVDEAAVERYKMPALLRAYAVSLAADDQPGGPLPGGPPDDRHGGLAGLLDYYLCATAAATTAAFPFDRDRQPSVPVTGVACPRFAGYKDALSWLSTEHANLVAIIRFAAATDRRDHTWQLAVLLWRYVYTAGHIQDWTDTLSLALEQTTKEPPSQLGTAEVLLRLAGARWCSGDLVQAHALAGRALRLWTELGDARGEADALCALALPTKDLGQYREAEQHLREALIRYERIGDVRGQANALDNLGDLYGRRHEPARAKDHHERALALLRRIGHIQGLVHSLDNLAGICQQLGELTEAMAYLREALQLARDIGDRSGEAYAQNNMGKVHRLQGDIERAMRCHEEALAVANSIADPMLRMELHNTLGEASQTRDNTAAAMENHHTALRLARRTGAMSQQARAHRGLARALHTSGDHDSAAEHWQAAAAGYRELDRPEADEIAGELAALGCACATRTSTTATG